jgi:opacity protein-like surface antigen
MFKKIVVFAVVIFSASAFAQATKFAGASIGINTGFESNQTAVAQTGGSLGGHSSPLNINGSYTFLMTPAVTIATGLTYDLKNATTATFTSGNAKLKNHYSLNIEPGYALSENTLGYFKVAYHRASSSLSSGALTFDKTVKGWGYGFGAKHKLDKNFFINIEIQQVGYGTYQPNSNVSTGTITPTSTFATIGFGYQF